MSSFALLIKFSSAPKESQFLVRPPTECYCGARIRPLMASEVVVTKRVSLITGLLITGLDWTGLES